MLSPRNSENDEAASTPSMIFKVAPLALASLLIGCGQSSQQSAPPAQPAPVATAPAAEPAAGAETAPSHPHSLGAEMPSSQPSKAESAPHTHAPGTAAHQDHDSKHGGDFFMAFDEKHHLEGILTEPGVFRLYLFDEYSKPLAKAALSQADARVAWGKAENAPETALKLSADGLTLEAKAPAKINFPTELTLRIRLPGAAAGSRPELFTFPFKAYTHTPASHKH